MIAMNETPRIAPDLSPAIPEALMKTTGILHAGPQRPTTFTKEMLAVPQGTIIPGTPALKLMSSVFASIDRTNDGVLISSVLFDEEGYGRTYEDAWTDFIASLRDKFSSLEKRESKLAASDRAVLAQLRQSIALAA